MIFRIAVVLACLAPAAASLARAQVASDSALGDTLIVDRPLAGTSDTLRLHLVSGGQYRVAVRPAGATLAATSADSRASVAFPARVREGVGTSPTIIELYPPRTAQYLIVISAADGMAGGRIQVWADQKLAKEKQESRDRAWGIGFGLGGGWHSGYYTGADDENGGESGSSVEGCLLVGSSGPVSGCFGFIRQELGSDQNAVTWYFVEPRFRAATFQALGRPVDVVATARIGLGNSERLSIDPSMFAPGVLLAYHLDDRPGARGWKLNLQAIYAFVGNVNTTAGTSDFFQATLGLSWIP